MSKVRREKGSFEACLDGLDRCFVDVDLTSQLKVLPHVVNVHFSGLLLSTGHGEDEFDTVW